MKSDDYFDIDNAIDHNQRTAVAFEILGYLEPHVLGIRNSKERSFIRDLIYKRRCSLVAGSMFVLSDLQWRWLLNVAYRHGFRANDAEFWKAHNW